MDIQKSSDTVSARRPRKSRVLAGAMIVSVVGVGIAAPMAGTATADSIAQPAATSQVALSANLAPQSAAAPIAEIRHQTWQAYATNVANAVAGGVAGGVAGAAAAAKFAAPAAEASAVATEAAATSSSSSGNAFNYAHESQTDSLDTQFNAPVG